ncbi:MAG TPA: molybdopterin-dependent oxidoreductase [Caulobacteraceae bacterium]|jgi:DMSO/TMAO reductase YedYZ molybdopterin-dependent catalytic subunit|nr:molybdopterin-dependent oxidoreductase [Caulobacteraceae bacterium]
MLDRRELLRAGTGAALGAAGSLAAAEALAADPVATLPFANGERPIVRYPQKRPMLQLTARPPQLETPFKVFDEATLTPNDAFFVRYHLADTPPPADPDTWHVDVAGEVERPVSIALNALRTQFKPIEYVAVLQCSGNSRGFFEPRVGGGQAGNGMMGNARWKGVPLKAVLEKAGVKASAKQVQFDGADGPVMQGTPDFAKALDVSHVMDGEVMLAFEMNGKDLPLLNGFPVRLIVPGWYGTYWVKHVNQITVLDHPLDNFWMKTAYRIPDNDCACIAPGTAPTSTIPINRLNTRSFITNIADGAKVKAHKRTHLRGMAFDGGSGIRSVEISTDGGKSWKAAKLGPDLGKFAFRPWTADVTLSHGAHALKVRAVSNTGKGQPMEPTWNPSGYMRNVVETVHVTAA